MTEPEATSTHGREISPAEAMTRAGEPRDRGGGRPTVGRRVTAATALLAFVLALVSAAVALAQPLLVLPLVVLGLAGAVLAGWTALVSRGRRRVIAAAVALAALGTSLVLAGVQSVVGMAVVAALVVGSNAAARVALPAPPPILDPAFRRVGPAHAGVLLVNPGSGGGRAARLGLAEEAERRGVRPVVVQPGTSLRALAERAAQEGADVLGVAGGDGSQAVVADVARRHGLGFVCVPAGTRNHFALDLGLDVHDVVGALDAFTAAVERRVDLGLVRDRVFVNNASIGVYGSIVQSPGYRAAKLATVLELLPELLGPQAAPADLRFPGRDGAPWTTADLLLISNNPYAVDPAARRVGRPNLDGGVLGIVALRADPRNPGQEWTAERFVVDSSRPVPVGLDGEALLLEPPLEFRTLPGMLRVRLPVTARGASVRQPQPGPVRTVVALLRVLAGRPQALR
jgi:Diacylglycerol kinase catalytic domain